MSKRSAYFKSYNAKRPNRARGKKRGGRLPCLGIDGEGFESGSVYAYMACATTEVEVEVCEDLRGLSTYKILEFLLELPRAALIFGFSLGYDYTHWLKDLDDKALWDLARPEERVAKGVDGKPWHRSQ